MSDTNEDKKYLTLPKLAREIGIPVELLRRFERGGLIPKLKRRRRRFSAPIYTPDDIDRIKQIIFGNGKNLRFLKEQEYRGEGRLWDD